MHNHPANAVNSPDRTPSSSAAHGVTHIASYFTVSLSGVILTVDAQSGDLLGYTLADLLGQNLLFLFHMQDRERLRHEWTAFLASPHQRLEGEFNRINRNGDRVPTKVTARLLQGDNQTVILLSCEEPAQSQFPLLHANVFSLKTGPSDHSLTGSTVKRAS